MEYLETITREHLAIQEGLRREVATAAERINQVELAHVASEASRVSALQEQRQSARSAVLDTLIQSISTAVIEHATRTHLAGNSLVRFNVRKRRFGVAWRYTATQHQQYACYTIGKNRWGRELILRSDGQTGKIVGPRFGDKRFNKSSVGIWLSGDDYDSKIAVLRGLYQTFYFDTFSDYFNDDLRATVRQIINGELSQPGFDNELCFGAFDVNLPTMQAQLEWWHHPKAIQA